MVCRLLGLQHRKFRPVCHLRFLFSTKLIRPRGHTSTTEPWIVGHNVMIAHANVVKMYREDFKSNGSMIGITLNGDWVVPYDDSPESEYRYHMDWLAADCFRCPGGSGQDGRRCRMVRRSHLPWLLSRVTEEDARR